MLGALLRRDQNMYLLSCFLMICFVYVGGFRLPKDVFPEHYKLEIVSYLGEKDNFNFDGKVWIQVNVKNPTQNITLHSKDLNIREREIVVTDITHNGAKKVKVSSITYEEDNDFLIILLSGNLVRDHKYEVFINFNGKLNDDMFGFYRSSYYDNDDNQIWLGVTQFEPTSARKAFPCYDEPEMKATFDISIGRKHGYEAISNMPLLLTEPMKKKPGWFWDRFNKTLPMSTYLVAYIVSDFDYKIADSPNNNVVFGIWARREALDQVGLASEIGPKVLEYFEEFFEIPFPLPKQDIVAIPDLIADSMGNWGLITYHEYYLLHDSKLSSETSRLEIANSIAHELANQWFGNLVTMKWWTDSWLNEGFATFLADLAVDHLFPQWNTFEEEVAVNLGYVFSFDSLRTSHPVSVAIGDPKEIDEIFDVIFYEKGSLLIRMMGLFLGEETLRKGVSNYLNKYKFKNPEQNDLWDSLTQEAHKNKVLPNDLTVKKIMDTWTLQTGFPVITVTRNYEKGNARIVQQRYLRDMINTKDTANSCWWVPLTYSTRQNLNFDKTTPEHWLSCPANPKVIEHIADEKDWVIFNNKMSGIYKVNYDEKNWNLLIKYLQTEDYFKIPTLNRVQLLSDAADLASVGSLKYDTFFELLKYLKVEEEYLPWKTALFQISSLTTYLKKSSIYGVYKEYIKEILTPMYENTGGLAIPASRSDQPDYIKLGVLVASEACQFEVANCITNSKQLFNKLKTNLEGKNIIPTDLQEVVYCTALKHGGKEEWEFLWEKYQNSNVATEQDTILNALGCTQEKWLLERYLEWSLSHTKIRKQDSTAVFIAVARNDIGYNIAKKFFFDNIETIFQESQPEIPWYLLALPRRMVDERDLDELEQFIEKNKKKFSEVKKEVELSLETVKINIQWQNKHADAIKKTLRTFSSK